MAFDLYAFDLFAAPRDRHDFLDWISRNFRDTDGALGGDPHQLTPALQGWYREMSRSFPPVGVQSYTRGDINSTRSASYRLNATAIQASFDWEACGPAAYRAKRAAQAHGVGLFEASSHDGAVWMMSSRGRWEAVHRGDDRRSFA